MNPWEEIKRHARLKTIREANRKSRHRKKVLVEMLQGRIEFFTRTNEQLRQNNDVLEGLLILARNNLRKQQEQQITQNAFVAYWLAMVPLSNAAFGSGGIGRDGDDAWDRRMPRPWRRTTTPQGGDGRRRGGRRQRHAGSR